MSVKTTCKDCGVELEAAVGVPITLICNGCGSSDIVLPPSVGKTRDDSWPSNMYMLTVAVGDPENKFPVEKKIGGKEAKSTTKRKTATKKGTAKRVLKPRRTRKTKK